MSKLASRWATDETLVQKAVEQDSKSHTKEKPAATTKNTLLSLKWADAPVPTSPKKQPQKQLHELNLPSGPKGYSNEGKGRQRRGSRHEREKPKEQKEMSEFAKLFADRLGVEEHKDKNRKQGKNGKKHEKSAKHETLEKSETPKKSEQASIAKSSEPSANLLDGALDDDYEDISSDEEGDVLHEKGPQTEAGNVLAMRLGLSGGKSKQEQKPVSSEPKKRYMTPRQKKEMAAKEQQEKLRKEKERKNAKAQEMNAEKEARLRHEVQEILAKMEDKSTNWADFEDEE